MSQSNTEIAWDAVLEAIPDVERWNLNLPRLVADNGPEFKKYAQAEAGKRGYLWSTTAKMYVHPWRMIPCTHPGKLLGVGWRSGKLRVVFRDGSYESTKLNVPSWTAMNIVDSKTPDVLYQSIKGKFDMVKVS